MAILHADIGQPWRDVTASVTWLEERVKELFADGLVWRPGAAELLAAVTAAAIPAALVTATRRHLVEVALETIGRAHFAAVVCGDEVDQTKPHPKPYLTAADLLGVDIAELRGDRGLADRRGQRAGGRGRGYSQCRAKSTCRTSPG